MLGAMNLFEAPALRCRVSTEEVSGLFEDFFPEFEEEPEDLRAYLQKEDIITTLIREKKSRYTAFKPDAFMESLSEKIMSKGSNGDKLRYVKSVVKRSVVNPMLEGLGRDLLEAEGDISVVDFTPLKELTGGKVCPLTSGEERMLKILLEKSGVTKETVGVAIEAPSGDRYSLSLSGDLRKNYRRGGRIFRGNRAHVYYNVDGESIALLYIRKKVAELFQEHCEKAESERRLEDDPVYRLCLQGLEHRLKDYMNSGNSQILIHNDYGKYRLPASIPDKYLVQDICNHLGYRYEVISDQEVADGRDGSRKAIDAAGVSRIYGFCAAMNPVLSFSIFNTERTVPGFRWDYAAFCQETAVEELLSALYDNYREVKERDRDLRELEKISRADVYQTKKNIPEKFLKAMRDCKFNESFGFVEIDSECDLGLLPELEKEFLALKKDGFLKDQDCSGVAIRFRKLHRYRADGLYFPGLLCLCVDVRNPSTFCHEAFHMVDYERGGLSAGYSFLPIKKEYERIIRRNMKNCSKEEQKRLAGNSKYNLEYYLKPTEVFARCGEIYMTRIRNIKNSLCRPTPGFEYPEKEGNEGFYKLVEEYYNLIFSETKEAEAS